MIFYPYELGGIEMKFLKMLSVIMAMLMLCCLFVACDEEEGGGDITLPDRELYNVTVSFQIKSSDGKTQIEALDYIVVVRTTS